MYLTSYINERELVEAFIRKTQTGTINVDGYELHIFIWGTEITIIEQNDMGRLRAIDLIGTDIDGRVWLIEAKLGGNPELSQNIWDKQLIPYRIGIANLNVDTINNRSRRFLSASGQYGHLTMAEGYESLADAIVRWGKKLGKTVEYGRTLFNRTITAINNQDVIATILADRFDEAAWDARPKDVRAYGYILEGQKNFIARMEGHPQRLNTNIDYFSVVKTWKELSSKAKKIKASPDNVAEYLATPAAEYYQRCLDNLRELGWTGNCKSNEKAFTINLPTYHGESIRLHLGWADFDSSVPLKYRVAGEYGLKFNIDFRLFKESDDSQIRQEGYHLALSLAKSTNYTGRGDALGVLKYKKDFYIDVDEKTKKGGSWGNWDGETQRWINKTDRDYVGLPREEVDFIAAWEFLRKIIDPVALASLPTKAMRKNRKETEDLLNHLIL